jgi:hypothetical protein
VRFHQGEGIDCQDNLWSPLTSGALTIQTIWVEPEEHAGIHERVPFGWREPDQAGPERVRGHGLLVPNLDAVWQRRVLRPLFPLQPPPLITGQACDLKQVAGWKQTGCLDGRPVRCFGQMVHVPGEFSTLHARFPLPSLLTIA